MQDGRGRHFLFLQGPHGPFFSRLARALAARGAGVTRLAFNAGDVAEWAGAGPLHRFGERMAVYGAWLDRLLDEARVTDMVLYGEARPVHAIALDLARRRGIGTHCLEEGYLRPSWITYERQGTNGNSPLTRLPLERMGAALQARMPVPATAEARWGDSRQHLWWSTLYHARLLLPSRQFRGYRGHRELTVGAEAALYAARALSAPLRRVRRARAVARLARAGVPFHLGLLQLAFDCSMKAHSRFASNLDFVTELLDGFAAGAPAGHHLVLKAHPFDDGRERLAARLPAMAAERGLGDRFHFVDGGGGLAPLLDRSASVALINSTAAHPALQRGLPVLALGDAVFTRPGLVSRGDVASFYAAPEPPDMPAYRTFRDFMMATTQIRGSFYSAEGIARALCRLPTEMLEPLDRYQRLLGATPAAPSDWIRHVA